jgi:hypothetical protein
MRLTQSIFDRTKPRSSAGSKFNIPRQKESGSNLPLSFLFARMLFRKSGHLGVRIRLSNRKRNGGCAPLAHLDFKKLALPKYQNVHLARLPIVDAENGGKLAFISRWHV